MVDSWINAFVSFGTHHTHMHFIQHKIPFFFFYPLHPPFLYPPPNAEYDHPMIR